MLIEIGNVIYPKDLVDGKRYWLGAVAGTYNERSEVFTLDKCFIPLENVYKVYEILNDPKEVNDNE